MSTEIAGACVLTKVLDLLFEKKVNMNKVTKCIERIADEMTNEKQ